MIKTKGDIFYKWPHKWKYNYDMSFWKPYMIQEVSNKTRYGTRGTQINYYDEIRFAKKKCSKLKLEELGYSCIELENQKINIDKYN